MTQHSPKDVILCNAFRLPPHHHLPPYFIFSFSVSFLLSPPQFSSVFLISLFSNFLPLVYNTFCTTPFFTFLLPSSSSFSTVFFCSSSFLCSIVFPFSHFVVRVLSSHFIFAHLLAYIFTSSVSPPTGPHPVHQ